MHAQMARWHLRDAGGGVSAPTHAQMGLLAPVRWCYHEMWFTSYAWGLVAKRPQPGDEPQNVGWGPLHESVD